MKTFSFIMLLFLSCTLILNAQESTDTTFRSVMFSDPEILLQQPKFTLPFSIALVTAGTESPIPLFQSFAGTPRSFAWEHRDMIDLTAPLKLQLRGQEKYQTIKITLGAAQAAGTAYILYRNLKKYGFK